MLLNSCETFPASSAPGGLLPGSEHAQNPWRARDGENKNKVAKLRSKNLEAWKEAKLASRSVLQPPNPQVSDCCDVVVCWADQVPHCFQLRIYLPYESRGKTLASLSRLVILLCFVVCFHVFFTYLTNFVVICKISSPFLTQSQQNIIRCWDAGSFNHFCRFLRSFFCGKRSSLSIRFFGARVESSPSIHPGPDGRVCV